MTDTVEGLADWVVANVLLPTGFTRRQAAMLPPQIQAAMERRWAAIEAAEEARPVVDILDDPDTVLTPMLRKRLAERIRAAEGRER